MESVLSRYSASISELKKNPTALIEEADGEVIAILNHNKPTAYLIPADTYKELLEKLEDRSLARMIEKRLNRNPSFTEVDIDNL